MDRAAMLHVLAVERVAASLDGGRDDESIIEGEPVVAGERQGSTVRLGSERPHLVEDVVKLHDRQFNDSPVKAEFSPGGMGEFIEHLGADHAA